MNNIRSNSEMKTYYKKINEEKSIIQRQTMIMNQLSEFGDDALGVMSHLENNLKRHTDLYNINLKKYNDLVNSYNLSIDQLITTISSLSVNDKLKDLIYSLILDNKDCIVY